MTDSPKTIQQLEYELQVLMEENSLLAERAEDSLLLSLVTKSIQQTDRIDDVFSIALEKISILKQIPYATCGVLNGNTVEKIELYSGFSDNSNCGYPITLSDTVVDELSFGPAIARLPTDLAGNFDLKEFRPTLGVIIPFSTRKYPQAVFIFIDHDPEVERLANTLGLLNHVVETVAARCDIFFLMEAVKQANLKLEKRVEQRTRDLRAANAALKQSEMQYRQLIELAIDAVFVAQDEKIVYTNTVTSKMLGYSEAELLSTPFLKFIHPEYRQLVKTNYQKRLAGDSDLPATYSFSVYNKQGQELIFETSSTRVDWAGKPATLNYARDITLQRTLEKSLQQTRKMEAIGKLASGIAHDFNNMLSGILGAAELLQKHLPDTPKAHRYHQMIVNTASRASDLTSRLLSFSRRAPLMPVLVDVHEMINTTLSLLEKTIDPRIRLSIELNAETYWVKGDYTELQNALINLVINSTHAMPEGGVLTLISEDKVLLHADTVTSTFSLKPGPYIQITVRDTGYGIDPDNITNIFEPFFTTKDPGSGTGLGLASVYGTMKQHLGAITVQSDINQGTVFDLYLPVSPRKEISVSRKADPVRGKGRILVIDDEEVVRFTAQGILEDLGYSVEVAGDGKEGVQKYAAEPDSFDLVLLDMVMPVMNGKDCFVELLAINPQVRVILTSGFAKETDIQAMKQAGLKDFVRKPYTSVQLSEVIHTVLKKR